jgi:glycosyltransferase involved in cell wall biosynthesis
LSRSRAKSRERASPSCSARWREFARGIPFRACLAGPAVLLDDPRRLHFDPVVSVQGLVADAFGLIGQADVFVMPSLSEQSGSLAVLEALQAGRAIVASGVDGIAEDVTDGHDALLAPPDDERLLAEALARALVDEPLRRRLGARARETLRGQVLRARLHGGARRALSRARRRRVSAAVSLAALDV